MGLKVHYNNLWVKDTKSRLYIFYTYFQAKELLGFNNYVQGVS